MQLKQKTKQSNRRKIDEGGYCNVANKIKHCACFLVLN
jgi:hypothetical protein